MSEFWRCPKCSAVLKKSTAPGIVADLEHGGSTIGGWVTCENCSSSYNAGEVYAGKYDVSADEAYVWARARQGHTSS
ncbi:MAG: hypothetical protein ACRD1P_13605, partial [Thermoanaerobaculia bacterium]